MNATIERRTSADILADARILIVDDEESNVILLQKILERAGCRHVECVTDPLRLTDASLEAFAPDLLLLDLYMPHVSGFEVMEELGRREAAAAIPVMVLTADNTSEVKWRALAMGARDFLTKPFDATEVLLRASNLLEMRLLHRDLAEQNSVLEEKVRARTEQLREARDDVLERLAMAAEFRDDATGQHTKRVGRTAGDLASAMGLSAEEIERIARTAPLHDVGKIGVPDAVLLKRGVLGPDEFDEVSKHTTIGARMLSGEAFPLLDVAKLIALTHHERWDGTGYPQGLRGEAIPTAGRIVAVADAFDAMTHDRPYRKACSVDAAISEIRDRRGTQFDPDVVDAFLVLVAAEEFLEHAED
jgi:putative two-component system response regulator